MGIPIGQQSTATVKGRTYKVCCCETCRLEFVYTVERTGVGSGSSLLFLDNAGARNRAGARANQNLEKALQQAVDAVACPQCGWFQAEMIAAEKSKRLSRCLWVGLPLGLILLLFGFAASANFLYIAGWLCLIGGPVAGIVWQLLYQPNSYHAGVGTSHPQHAQTSRAIPRAVFEARIAQQAQQAQQAGFRYP